MRAQRKYKRNQRKQFRLSLSQMRGQHKTETQAASKAKPTEAKPELFQIFS